MYKHPEPRNSHLCQTIQTLNSGVSVLYWDLAALTSALIDLMTENSTRKKLMKTQENLSVARSCRKIADTPLKLFIRILLKVFSQKSKEIKKNSTETVCQCNTNAEQKHVDTIKLFERREDVTKTTQGQINDLYCSVLSMSETIYCKWGLGPGPGVCSLSIKCVPPLSPPSLGPNLEKYRRRAKSRNL